MKLKYLKQPKWYYSYLIGLFVGAIYQILININIYFQIIGILMIFIIYIILYYYKF